MVDRTNLPHKSHPSNIFEDIFVVLIFKLFNESFVCSIPSPSVRLKFVRNLLRKVQGIPHGLGIIRAIFPCHLVAPQDGWRSCLSCP